MCVGVCARGCAWAWPRARVRTARGSRLGGRAGEHTWRPSPDAAPRAWARTLAPPPRTLRPLIRAFPGHFISAGKVRGLITFGDHGCLGEFCRRRCRRVLAHAAAADVIARSWGRAARAKREISASVAGAAIYEQYCTLGWAPSACRSRRAAAGAASGLYLTSARASSNF